MPDKLVERTEKAIVLLEELVEKTQNLIEKVERLIDPQIITDDISIYIGAIELNYKANVYGYLICFKEEDSFLDIRSTSANIYKSEILALRSSLDFLTLHPIKNKKITIYCTTKWLDDYLNDLQEAPWAIDPDLGTIVKSSFEAVGANVLVVDSALNNEGLAELYRQLQAYKKERNQ